MIRKTFALMVRDEEDPKKESESVFFQEVTGTWVFPIPGLKTFIWSDMDEDVTGFNAPHEVFHVVEARSGICIGRGFYPDEAIEGAKLLCRTRGLTSLKEKIRETVSRYGHSPAYREEPEHKSLKISEADRQLFIGEGLMFIGEGLK